MYEASSFIRCEKGNADDSTHERPDHGMLQDGDDAPDLTFRRATKDDLEHMLVVANLKSGAGKDITGDGGDYGERPGKGIGGPTIQECTTKNSPSWASLPWALHDATSMDILTTSTAAGWRDSECTRRGKARR